MIQLHAALRQQGIPTYIFSNTNELAVSHIRRTFPFFANFDGYILSYEHGAMKPDAGSTKSSSASPAGAAPKSSIWMTGRKHRRRRRPRLAGHPARIPEESRAAIEKLGLLNHSA